MDKKHTYGMCYEETYGRRVVYPIIGGILLLVFNFQTALGISLILWPPLFFLFYGIGRTKAQKSDEESKSTK